MLERAVQGGWRWRVKMTMMQVNHPAVMAATAFCIVNISMYPPGENVKRFEVLFTCCSLSECIYICCTLCSTWLGTLNSTWLNTTCKTVWGQPKMPAAVQRNPFPSRSPSAPVWLMVTAYARLCPSNSACFALL